MYLFYAKSCSKSQGILSKIILSKAWAFFGGWDSGAFLITIKLVSRAPPWLGDVCRLSLDAGRQTKQIRGLVLILGVELAFGRSDRCRNPVRDSSKCRRGEVRGFENGGSLQDHWHCLTNAKSLQSIFSFILWSMKAWWQELSLKLCV